MLAELILSFSYTNAFLDAMLCHSTQVRFDRQSNNSPKHSKSPDAISYIADIKQKLLQKSIAFI